MCIIGRMEKEARLKCLRHEISNIVEKIDNCKDNKEKEKNMLNRRIKKLKDKGKQTDLFIMKADKGNTMEKSEYLHKENRRFYKARTI